MSSILFSPLQIRSVTFKNRIAVSPMCMYSSQDGQANDWHLVHLGSRAVGGAGLVLTEATAVSAQGRISPGDLGIWKDEQIDSLRRLTSFIHAQGAVAGIQLAHAGRKASQPVPWAGSAALPADQAWETLAPSKIPFSEKYPTPTPLSEAGIQLVTRQFQEAAVRAQEAGFKVLEIHAAHGYLLHEFLSPLSNTRQDAYGGSFENRIRFLKQVAAAIRQVWPEELPLFVRVSASDWTEGGWTIDDSVALVKALAPLGVDLIDCSSGGNVPRAPIPAQPGYQVPFAEKIRRETGVKTAAVGLITHARQAEEILASEQADLVFLARAFLRDPYFPYHAAQELGETLTSPVQYERAWN